MVSQATKKVQVAVNPHSKTVMRSYQVALKCVDQHQREEINRRIRKLEEQQLLLLSPQIVKKAETLYKSNPKEGFFTRQLCKEVGKSPNIAESAFHWLHIAIKGKREKEQKVQALLNFLLKNPQQLVEWMIFGRSPYTESSLGNYWKLKRRYVINLLTSARQQADGYWRKRENKTYTSNNFHYNSLLTSTTQQAIVQAINDALFFYNNAFTTTPQVTKRQQAFLAKLKLLKKEQAIVVPFLISWINSPQPSRWKSLKILAEQLAKTLGKPSRKLFSAVRLIIVFTLFDHFMQSVPQLTKGLPVAKVVPLPFKHKKKGRLPIKLLMKKDYVITRQGNAKTLTTQIKKQGWTELGFPQKGKKKLVAKTLFPSKAREYIHNGAEIKLFQVSSGQAPSYKPRVDVVLEGAMDCFHSSTLLHTYLPLISSQKKAILGLDINRLGVHMLAFNTSVSLPPDILLLAERYTHLTAKVLPELHRGLMRKRKARDTLGFCKLQGELNRVYTRRMRIIRELTRLLPHLLAAVLVKKQCKTLKIEQLTVDPSGTKGALAKAIYTMPDNLFIYQKAVWLASQDLGYQVQLESVRPYHTSSVHYGCGGTLVRLQGQYDLAPCTKCGRKVNTHINAAHNIASLSGTPLPPL
jgi:hypothetical protein